ncbi:KAP family P-loop NTPase fold protein [Piscirickettsia salmonis]|uniref:KAP family P-loop NTPase fold protein n=1 Tax=Piscirickettsia salmonis TaxID=1238 RepID=UPI003EB92BF9
MHDVANDCLDRRVVSSNLANLLEKVDHRYSPILLDGPWGTGKTTIIQYAKENLKDQGQPYLYINADLHDNSDNPLTVLLGVTMKELGTKKDEIIRKAKPFLKKTLKIAAKSVIHHVTKVDSTELTKLFKDEANASIDELLNDHAELEKQLESLRNLLQETMKDKSKLVIFVDELDRCRPTFALELLEVIKHIFSVENIVFVLIANGHQLKAVIKHAYGYDLDAEEYFNKFIKHRITLPEITPKGDCITEKFVNDQLGKLDIDKYTKDSDLSHFITALMKQNESSLRQVETFFRHLDIYSLIGVSEFDPRKYSNYFISFCSAFCTYLIAINRSHFSALPP